MKITLTTTAPSQLETECLVVPVFDEGEGKSTKPVVASSDAALKTLAQPLIDASELTGKLFETVYVFSPAGLKAKRLLFVGVGKAKGFSSVELRQVAGVAVRAMKPRNLKSFALVSPANETSLTAVEAVRTIAEGVVIGNFDPDYYKSDRKDQQVEQAMIAVTGSADKSLQTALDQGVAVGESQNFTRDLVNEPGNKMTPTILADRAQKMCSEMGLDCEVYGPDKIKELKMGAFWSVAQGSDEEPRLVIMRYEPAGAPEKPVLGLVGKGITFDSGGISLKPGDGMEKMKYDMAGGASMIGAMRAIALLKPNVRVIGIVCATENMPSGKAQKPGDVQIAMNGKSIEIINTDAEGRLVLADGLHYARQLGATHLVDAATLTGAVVVALGYHNVGVFCNDDTFFGQFDSATKAAGEKMWRLPVDQEYFEQIKSEIADIKNTGGRWGGAITAAMFLKEFVEDTPWIHLDIAGTTWIEDSKPYIAKGPSGTCVRTLVELTKQLAENEK